MSDETLQFWGLVGPLSVIAIGLLVVPLVRRRRLAPAVREEYDINVFKDQLGEIERDLDRGLLDQPQAEAARLEIKRRMLAAAGQIDQTVKSADADKEEQGLASNLGLITMIVLALPAAAVTLYLNLGRLDQPDQPFAERSDQTRMAGNSDLNSAIDKLKKRLLENPDDVRGWMLLGRSYRSLRQYVNAAEVYGRAYGLSGEDSEIGTEYAEAVILASDSKITPLAEGILKDALRDDPMSAKARFYLAMLKAQLGDLEGAMQGWIDLAVISPPGAPWMSIVNGQIQRAGEELGIDPTTIKPSTEARDLAIAAAKNRPQMTPDPDSGAPGPTAADVKAAGDMTSDDRNSLIRSMVKRLADRLQEEPDDKQGWQRLERAYRVLGETALADQAAAAIAKLPQ